MTAKELSERIRMKRKSLKDSADMVDTAALPKMNPQDVWQKEKEMQWEETIPNAVTPSSVAQAPVMEEEQKDDSQDMAILKKKMAMVGRILARLKMSDKSGNYGI
jgi:hypothetical protein